MKKINPKLMTLERILALKTLVIVEKAVLRKASKVLKNKSPVKRTILMRAALKLHLSTLIRHTLKRYLFPLLSVSLSMMILIKRANYLMILLKELTLKSMRKSHHRALIRKQTINV